MNPSPGCTRAARPVRARPAFRSAGREVLLKGGIRSFSRPSRCTRQNALEFAKSNSCAARHHRSRAPCQADVVTGEAGCASPRTTWRSLGSLSARRGLGRKRIIPAAWVERVRRGNVATDFGNTQTSVVGSGRDVFMAPGGTLSGCVSRNHHIAILRASFPITISATRDLRRSTRSSPRSNRTSAADEPKGERCRASYSCRDRRFRTQTSRGVRNWRASGITPPDTRSRSPFRRGLQRRRGAPRARHRRCAA